MALLPVPAAPYEACEKITARVTSLSLVRYPRAGRVRVAGVERDVGSEPATGEINDRVDADYRAKCAPNTSLTPRIADRAKAATVKSSLPHTQRD